MSRRLSAQTRKSVADIARPKAHSLLIVAALILAVGGLVAVNVADDGLSAAYAFTVAADVRQSPPRPAPQETPAHGQRPATSGHSGHAI